MCHPKMFSLIHLFFIKALILLYLKPSCPRSPTTHGVIMLQWVNSLRPSDAIWRQWSWTTLAQVMACCLTAPSHYLNQCWLIIRGVLLHTSESSFAGIAQGIDSGYEFEKDILKNIFKSPRGQWVNPYSTYPQIISGKLAQYYTN